MGSVADLIPIRYGRMLVSRLPSSAAPQYHGRRSGDNPGVRSDASRVVKGSDTRLGHARDPQPVPSPTSTRTART